MSRPLIRVARAEDDRAIGEILVEAFVTQYARKMPEVVVHDARKADLRNVAEKRQIGTVLVADIDGKVVGTVTVLPPGAPRSEAWQERMADIRMVGLDLNYRGQGIADLLLDEVERMAREDWGCTTIGLHVRRGAQGVAELYMRRGFQRQTAGDIDRLPEVYLEGYVKTFSQGEKTS